MRDSTATGSTSQYQLILDGLPDLLFVVDRGGRIVLINQTLLNALPSLGVEGTPLGRRWREVFPFLPEAEADEIERVFLTGEARRSRVRAPIPGREADFQIARVPLPDSQGTVTEVACLVGDMEEERQREEALKRELRLARAVFESAPFAITVSDLDARIVDANARALQDARLSKREELIGRNAVELIEQSDRARALEYMVHTYREGAVRGIRYFLRRPDNTTHPVEMSTALMRDDQGAPVGYVAFSHDVTEQTLLEERLRQAHRLESMGRFAAGVAHEFNDLIMAIQSFSGFVRESLGEGHSALEDLGEVDKAAVQAEELVRQILAFARQTPSVPKRIDLNQWLQVFARTARQILGPEVASDFALAEGVWPVRVDPTALEQALVHLVVNAQDRMPEGGMLLVRTENASLAPDSPELPPGQEPGDYVRISVVDTGPEIPDGLRARLFEPFWRGLGEGVSEQRRPLGLPVVHGILTQAGGFVEAASSTHGPTELRVYLPRERDLTTRPDSWEGMALLGKETVLLVEDQDMVRAAAARTLRQQGYSVHEARSAEEAVDVLGNPESSIDLVLCDVVLPGQSGVDLARRVWETSPKLPVVLMSGFAPERLLDDTTRPLISGFLEKPFSSRELLKHVRKVLDR